MSGQDAGIQKLLEAEQTATAVVKAARDEKAEKIKLAQAEAEKEIDAYKAQREDAYKALMEAGKGDAAGRQATLEQETASSITGLQQSVGSTKKKASDAIVGWVTKVY